jgi:hypothetical protein
LSTTPLMLTVFEQCSNTKVPSTEHGRLHNNNISGQQRVGSAERGL